MWYSATFTWSLNRFLRPHRPFIINQLLFPLFLWIICFCGDNRHHQSLLNFLPRPSINLHFLQTFVFKQYWIQYLRGKQRSSFNSSASLLLHNALENALLRLLWIVQTNNFAVALAKENRIQLGVPCAGHNICVRNNITTSNQVTSHRAISN